MLAFAFELSEAEQEEWGQELGIFDSIIVILVLRTPLESLHVLTKAASLFQELGLYLSETATQFVLGHTEMAVGEYPELFESAENPEDWFFKMLNQPAALQVPDVPFFHEHTSTYQAYLGSCRLRITFEPTSDEILFVEELLSTLEAFFANSIEDLVLFARQKVFASVAVSDSSEEVSLVIGKSPEDSSSVSVIIPDGYAQWCEDNVESLDSSLRGIIAQLIAAYTFVEKESWEEIQSRLQKSSAFERALSFVPASRALHNVMGNDPSFSMSELIKELEQPYELDVLRDFKWHENTDSSELKIAREKDEPDHIAAPAPGDSEIPDFGNVRAQDTAIFDYINVELWNAAGWHGAAYLYSPGYTPTLALLFGNEEYGRRIFEEWRTLIGSVDRFEEIRVSIIKEFNSTLEGCSREKGVGSVSRERRCR